MHLASKARAREIDKEDAPCISRASSLDELGHPLLPCVRAWFYPEKSRYALFLCVIRHYGLNSVLQVAVAATYALLSARAFALLHDADARLQAIGLQRASIVLHGVAG